MEWGQMFASDLSFKVDYFLPTEFHFYVHRWLLYILKPLVGKSPYQVQNTQDFMQQIQGIKLQSDQCIMSYDVKALFTSLPIQPALDIIRKLLEENGELQQRTSMSVSHITSHLDFLFKKYLFYLPGQVL